MKTKLDKYYSANYEKLKEIATNILHNIHRIDLADTLVSESYLYIYNNLDKFDDKTNLESIAVRFMSKQIHWRDTKFKKKFIETNSNIELFSDYDYADMLVEDDIDEILEKEFEHQQKIEHINEKHSKLSIPDKILYDLSIVGEYKSSGKLATYLGLNRTTTYFMIKNLKQYFKDGYTTDN